VDVNDHTFFKTLSGVKVNRPVLTFRANPFAFEAAEQRRVSLANRLIV